MASQTASARWKRRNPEHVKAKLSEWLIKNKDRRRTWTQRYIAKRKSVQRAYDAERYLRPENALKRQLNRELRAEYMREFHKNNRHIWRVADGKRKAIKRKAGISNTKLISTWMKWWKSKIRIRCYWCRRISKTSDCHSDHIVPLARGGTHSVENLCVSCGDCNRHKHDKDLQRWNQEISQPILI